VAVSVRLTTNLLMQAPALVRSLWVMTGMPPQLSVATTALWSAGGTALAQETVTSVGMLLITGALVSLTEMVCVRLLQLPQLSVAATAPSFGAGTALAH